MFPKNYCRSCTYSQICEQLIKVSRSVTGREEGERGGKIFRVSVLFITWLKHLCTSLQWGVKWDCVVSIFCFAVGNDIHLLCTWYIGVAEWLARGSGELRVPSSSSPGSCRFFGYRRVAREYPHAAHNPSQSR